MVALTQADPDVLTAHTDVICSTSIERIVTGRNAVMKQIEVLICYLDDVFLLTSGIGGDVANHWAIRKGHSFDYWQVQPVEKAMLVRKKLYESDCLA